MCQKTFKSAFSLAACVALCGACIPGCGISEPTAIPSTGVDVGMPNAPEHNHKRQAEKQAIQSAMPEETSTTNRIRLVNDLRSPSMKQIFGLGDETMALAERTLLELGVDRKYNITSSFVGGVNKLRLELLPNAPQNKSIQVDFYFGGGNEILMNPSKLLEWLELDERLSGNVGPGIENAR